MDLSGPALDDLKRRAKRQIRSRARALRSAVPLPALAERSRAIGERLLGLPDVAQARGVALFYPMEEKSEIDLRAVDAACRARGARVYYPASGTETEPPELRLVADLDALEERGSGYREPPPSAPAATPEDLDVIVVPALAVAVNGHRIGYGAGFYDALLSRFAPAVRTVVVAHEFELLGELPTNDWDVPCDVIVTDARVVTVRPFPGQL